MIAISSCTLSSPWNLDRGEFPTPRRLTDVNADHEPGQWTQDGDYLITSRALDPASDEPLRSLGIFRVSVAGNRSEALTDATHTCHSPRVSPGDGAIAFLRSPTDSPTESILRLAVIQPGNSAAQDLNLTLDRSPATFQWASDGAAIIASIDSWGQSALYRFNLDGNYDELLTDQLLIEAIAVSDDGRVVFAASSPLNSGELFISAGKRRRL